MAAALVAAAALALAACGPATRAAVTPATATPSTTAAAAATASAAATTATTTATVTATATETAAIPTGPFVPNELGEIPILELHRIGATDGRWQITPAELRALVANLYAHGFRPVDFRDVVARRIDLPRGYAPVVLTFDDGDPSQFRWAPGGTGTTPAPDSAVGILWDFHKTHPGWGAAASFYVNQHPFGSDSAAKVRWLVAHGFEVGDHTLQHVDMTKLDQAQMLHQVGGMAAWIQRAVPGYKVSTLAYPYGFAANLAPAAWAGSVQGQSYHIQAALLVGASPSPSPYSRRWHPRRVPRIQVVNPDQLQHKSTVAYVWAGWEPRLLADGGRALYVSDGAPNRIAVRPGQASQLAASVPKSEVVTVPAPAAGAGSAGGG